MTKKFVVSVFKTCEAGTQHILDEGYQDLKSAQNAARALSEKYPSPLHEVQLLENPGEGKPAYYGWEYKEHKF